jgi:SecD/SecF fusion protein
MDTKLIWKFVIILALAALASLTIWQNGLKPGIDLAGGVSLLYQIDTTGLDDQDKRDLGQNMVTILRKRIDPDGTANIVWRVHGNDRIEVQMPQAPPDTAEKRRVYREKLDAIAAFNLDERQVRQALLEEDRRVEVFQELAKESTRRMEVLGELGEAYDSLVAARVRESEAVQSFRGLKDQLAELEIVVRDDLVKRWNQIDEPNQIVELGRLKADDAEKQAVVRQYVAARAELSAVRNALTGPMGLVEMEKQAWEALRGENIEIIKLEKILDSSKAGVRGEYLKELRNRFEERRSALDEVIKAHAERAKVAGQLDDAEDLIGALQGSGVLEFRILPKVGENVFSDAEIQFYVDRLDQFGPNPQKSGDDRYAWYEIKDADDFNLQETYTQEFAGTLYVLASRQPERCMEHAKGLNAWKLTSAFVGQDSYGLPAVHFALNEIGGKRFRKLTYDNQQQPLCILLDNVAYSAPNINEPIPGGRGIISGSFTLDEVRLLVDTLNAGSLPARLSDQPISVKNIGPTIGKSNLDAGLTAGKWGLIVVVISVICYYLAPGVLASIALMLNMLLILGVMSFSENTFTLPGIAGLILTIGMAVDANVLIFERLREEQERGNSLRMAIRNGYDRALSTIMDANITTFIVAMILWLVASEEVKGFAIVLMIGIVCSIFCALYVTRAVFDALTSVRILKNKVKMSHLVRNPNLSWMSGRPVFWVVSGILVLSGWFLFFDRDDDKYSIEFIGGSSVVVELNDKAMGMTREEVQDAVSLAGESAGIDNFIVQSVGEKGNQFEIVTTATNRLEVDLQTTGNVTAQEIQEWVAEKANELGDHRLEAAQVVPGDQPNSFKLETTQVYVARVKRVFDAVFEGKGITYREPQVVNTVTDAVRTALRGKLSAQENLEPDNFKTEPITHALISGRDYLDEYLGGLLITCDFGSDKSDTLERLKQRFDQTRGLSDFDDYGNNKMILFAPGNILAERLTQLEILVQSDSLVYDPDDSDAWDAFAQNEVERSTAILKRTTSLQRVTQIDASIGSESLGKALWATILSLLAIIIYIWIRFGTVRFGVAAVIALLHDVSIALGMVAASAWFSQTAIGRALLIDEFKIDLPMIAAFLTVIGYSLNDTIVVFDRIRENRGKQTTLTRETINLSINQTVPRTILTSITTLIVLVVMYIWGGPGLRGFNYVLIIGVLIGTYSSIAVAAPILFGARDEQSLAKPKPLASQVPETATP